MSSSKRHATLIQSKFIEGAITAQIRNVYRTGIEVKMAELGLAWLPANEISPPGLAPADPRSLVSLAEVHELKVVQIRQEIYEGHMQAVVSLLAAIRPELKEVYAWPARTVKTMKVEIITADRAIGTIKQGIRGQVQLESLRAIAPKDADWGRILPGDRVAGFVGVPNPWEPNDLVTLDVAGYARSDVKIHDVLCPGFFAGQMRDAPDCVHPPAKDMSTPPFVPRVLDQVLVVEDDTTLAEIIKKRLGDFGFAKVVLVETRAGAKQAIAMAETRGAPFDLALIDLHLDKGARDFHGIEVAQELQATAPGTAIVLMTADADALRKAVTNPEFQVDVCGILNKPFTSEMLLDALARGHLKPAPLVDFFGGTPRIPPSPRCDDSWSKEVHAVLNQVATHTCAQSVVLFSIHPISFRVAIVAACDPEARIRSVKANIERSPIRDAAIDYEDVFAHSAESWYADYPKHRWLQRAYGYLSCLGVPVRFPSEHAYALFALHWERGRFSRSQFSFVHDAARQIAAILKADRAERQLREAEPYELLGKAYGSMAHDLAHHLTTLQVDRCVKLIVERKELTAEFVDDLKGTHKAMHEAAKIVRTFQSIARAEREIGTDLDLVDGLTRCVSDLSTHYPVINDRVFRAPSVPNELRVPWRAGALRRVLSNLLLNAAQQIELAAWRDDLRGQVGVELTLETDENGRWVCIRIYDTGPGIHASDFERIFAVGYSTKPNGFGMGLDICRRLASEVILNQQKGEVRVRDSLLFCGTTFELRLPVAADQRGNQP